MKMSRFLCSLLFSVITQNMLQIANARDPSDRVISAENAREKSDLDEQEPLFVDEMKRQYKGQRVVAPTAPSLETPPQNDRSSSLLKIEKPSEGPKQDQDERHPVSASMLAEKETPSTIPPSSTEGIERPQQISPPPHTRHNPPLKRMPQQPYEGMPTSEQDRHPPEESSAETDPMQPYPQESPLTPPSSSFQERNPPQTLQQMSFPQHTTMPQSDTPAPQYQPDTPAEQQNHANTPPPQSPLPHSTVLQPRVSPHAENYDVSAHNQRDSTSASDSFHAPPITPQEMKKSFYDQQSSHVGRGGVEQKHYGATDSPERSWAETNDNSGYYKRGDSRQNFRRHHTQSDAEKNLRNSHVQREGDVFSKQDDSHAVDDPPRREDGSGGYGERGSAQSKYSAPYRDGGGGYEVYEDDPGHEETSPQHNDSSMENAYGEYDDGPYEDDRYSSLSDQDGVYGGYGERGSAQSKYSAPYRDGGGGYEVYEDDPGHEETSPQHNDSSMENAYGEYDDGPYEDDRYSSLSDQDGVYGGYGERGSAQSKYSAPYRDGGGGYEVYEDDPGHEETSPQHNDSSMENEYDSMQPYEADAYTDDAFQQESDLTHGNEWVYDDNSLQGSFAPEDSSEEFYGEEVDTSSDSNSSRLLDLIERYLTTGELERTRTSSGRNAANTPSGKQYIPLSDDQADKRTSSSDTQAETLKKSLRSFFRKDRSISKNAT